MPVTAKLVSGNLWEVTEENGRVRLVALSEAANTAEAAIAAVLEADEPPPLAEALAGARAAAEAQLVAWIEALAGRVTGPVPAAEMISWPIKEAAARRILAAAEAPGDLELIAAEAGVTGETAGDLVDLIVARADAYRAVMATLTGLRRMAAGAFAAASDLEALEAARLTVGAASASIEANIVSQLGL
jgi:hypothetical protein